MDTIEIPVPNNVIPTPSTQVIPPSDQEDDMFDKFLKKMVAFFGNLMRTSDTEAKPTVPLGVPPQKPQNIFGTIGSTIGTVANQAVKIAGQAVNVAETGVDSAVKGASEYIAEPMTPAPTVDVQDFLSQNYQSTTVPTTQPSPSK